MARNGWFRLIPAVPYETSWQIGFIPTSPGKSFSGHVGERALWNGRRGHCHANVTWPDLPSLNEHLSPWTYRRLFITIVLVDQAVLKVLGERIRQRRKSFDWTQEHLADTAEIDRSYIGGVERGERNLTFTVLCQICVALGCDVADITQGIPDLPP